MLTLRNRVVQQTGAIQALLSTASTATTAGTLSINKEVPKPFSEMPGDTGWPFIGSVELLKKLGNGKVRKESFYYEAFNKYGPIARFKVAGRNNWIVIAQSPEAAEVVFRADRKNPSRGRMFEETLVEIHKQNNWSQPMFIAQNENWRKIRSATSQQVTPKRVGNFTEPLCGFTDDLMDHLVKEGANNDGRIDDIEPIVLKWIFKNTAYFVYGENLDVYGQTTPEFIGVATEFIKQLNMLVTKPFAIFKYMPWMYNDFIKVATKMRGLGKAIMEKKVAQLSDEIARGTVDETNTVGILEQWIIEGKLEPEDALTQACDLLAGGLDTTKNTTTFLLWELAKQPSLQDQLCHEIKTVLGDKINPSWEDLQNLPLVRHCLKEILRMYPAIPINLRQLPEDVVIDGYHVPAGVTVLVANSRMSLSEEYFSEPELFNPDRWRKNKEDSVHPFTSLPFGYGQRGCYGRRLAELEIYILLTKLIPRFKLSTDQHSIGLFQRTVLISNEPVPVTFEERNL